MVSAINDVGHALGIKTIAEFVETEEHIRVLTDIGLDLLQGYGVGRPTPMIADDEKQVNGKAVSGTT